MNKDKTRFPDYIIKVITGIIAVIVAWLLIPMLGLITGIIVAVAVSAVVYMVLSYFNKVDTAEDSSQIEEAVSPSDNSIEALLQINLTLRKEIIPDEVEALFESIIDQLVDLLPKVNAEISGGELAWVINRMATEYLPEKSIRPYLALDESERNSPETISAVKEGIAGMQSELNEVESIISSHKTDEFNNKAKFLKNRFKI